MGGIKLFLIDITFLVDWNIHLFSVPYFKWISSYELKNIFFGLLKITLGFYNLQSH